MVTYVYVDARRSATALMFFFIPVVSSICVFYLIDNKTWIRCKLGARCMKHEDILTSVAQVSRFFFCVLIWRIG